MKETTIKNHILCEHCESDFTISYYEVSTSGKPKYCPFCNEELEEEEMDVVEENSDDDVAIAWPTDDE